MVSRGFKVVRNGFRNHPHIIQSIDVRSYPRREIRSKKVFGFYAELPDSHRGKVALVASPKQGAKQEKQHTNKGNGPDLLLEGSECAF